jgi:hypothetical protein
VIAQPSVVRCTEEEWIEFRLMAQHGMLFEIVEWIDSGRPTLRPLNKHTSAFGDAVSAPNLSLVQVLWERAWQDRAEAVSAMCHLAGSRVSGVVMRYLLEHECPVDHVTGYDLCFFHDLELIRLGLEKGVCILEPDGWASAFIRVGSRPLIRFYLEERDRIAGLRRDAVYALCESIKDSRLRAVGLLKWAGVDPFAKAPKYGDWESPEEEWDGFPALYLSEAKKIGELLELLKLKPNEPQWFDLVERIAVGTGDGLAEVYALVRNPDEVIRGSPIRSEALLRRLATSVCWGWCWNPSRGERLVATCIRLIELGVCLRWSDKVEIGSFRRNVYRSETKGNVFKVLSRAAELADEGSRADLAELVRVPTMRDLVIRNDASILLKLGIKGPASYDGPSFSVPRSIRPGRVKVSLPPICENQAVREKVAWSRAKHPTTTSVVPHAVKAPGARVLTRKMIYSQVWSKAVDTVAKEFGISGSMLARICTKLRVPRPPRGYWARPEQWRKKRKPPLPKWESREADYWAINPANVRAQRRLKEGDSD